MDEAAVRAVLAAKAADIEAELAELTRPADSSGGISFGKRVGDGTSIAVERLAQVAAHERLEAMLREVRRAEAKLDDGTYGLCAVGGEPISAARLEALPWATTCVDHRG